MRRPDVFTLDYSHPLAHRLEVSALFRTSSPCSDDLARRKILLSGAEIVSDGVHIPSSGYVAFDSIVNDASATAYTIAIRGSFSSLAGWANGDVFIRHGGMYLARYVGAYLRWYQGGSGANLSGLGDFGNKGDIDLCFIHNGIRRTIYYNGSVVYDADWLGLSKQSNSLYVGGDGTTFASGPSLIKHIFYHNRPLSASEVALLADRTDPMLGGLIVEERPVLYFDMGGSSAVEGPAVITAESTLALIGQKGAVCPATVAASASLGMGGVKGASAPLNIVGTSAVEADSQKFTSSPATIAAASALGMGGIKAIIGLDKEGPATFSASSTVAMGGVKGAIGQAWIGADSEIVAAGVKGGVGSAAWLATGAFQAWKAPDVTPITAAEVARIVRATPRMKTVTASARVRKVRYEVTRA